MTTHVALLRGINLGGRNRLPMKDLVEIFENAGCASVRTFIQSGNVIFNVSPKQSAQLPKRITAQIHEKFGFAIPVILRTHDELRDAISRNPFLRNGADENTLHLMFLADSPDSSRVQQLDPHRSPVDRYVVDGKEIFLHLPGGVADTKLTNAYFDSKLRTVSTGRNWRTVNKLVELTASNDLRK